MGHEANFSFVISFKSGEGDPRRIFDAASALIDAFQSLDRAVLPTIDRKIETSIVLEAVSAGSLRVRLANVLKSMDEDALKSGEWKKFVGCFLNGVRIRAIKFLDNEDGASNRLQEMKKEIVSDATATDVRHLPDYAPLQDGQLIAALDKIQKAKAELDVGDGLLLEVGMDEYRADIKETWLPSDKVESDAKQPIEKENILDLVLTLRKPDMIKDTMWQFLHGKRNINAAMRDEDWIEKYRARQIAILPGDALQCTVRVVDSYNEKGELIEQTTEIVKVKNVIRGGIQGILPL
ncbi:hypothetical protein LG047_11125 [Methylocystis sp. WRRC1]|uniref:hypothetical protein n=1 Tax=Methylocystis sp. WRRC1 TaxID=1732014 RepID=UPI001D153E12|nr:hypothetical protein [Methylocystis sp. WRRC1]MCC3245876.1 hypothetical protein [Methylocystis sp. WRRC1]